MRMRINIEGNGVTVRNSPQHTPRCIDVSTHLCGREVESAATFNRAKGDTDGSPAREAYISVRIAAKELSFEAPESEQAPASFARNATEQSLYFDIEDARALRDALTAALSDD